MWIDRIGPITSAATKLALAMSQKIVLPPLQRHLKRGHSHWKLHWKLPIKGLGLQKRRTDS
jgi:hypothetical protein